MVQISTLVSPSHGRATDRWFGGAKTSVRRAKCIAYAWRRHRSSWRRRADRNTDMPFWFTVTKGVYRDRKTGQVVPTVGRGRVIGFVTAADRRRAIPFLQKMGYDNFVEFRDVNATFALQIGVTAKKLLENVDANRPQPLKTGVLFSNRVKS